ncbi:MAG: Holliday junction resolvase-like protein [Candidatus Pacearchaeota archaeon]
MVDLNNIIFLAIFLLGLAIAYFLGNRVGAKNRDVHWETELLPNHRKDAIMRSRAVLGGQFSEQLAPFLPDFPYKPTECRFLGKPIDLIVFEGMDDKEISEVVFVEVKSSGSRLSFSEKKLKDAVKNKRIRWEEYRIPKNLTKKGEIDISDF